MRHVLHRNEIAEAVRARLQAEGVYCAVAPLLIGEGGLSFYRGFIGRMDAVIAQRPDGGVQRVDAGLDAIAARAARTPLPEILRDAETQRRLAAIGRGELPA